jgi:hypothetical protein
VRQSPAAFLFRVKQASRLLFSASREKHAVMRWLLVTRRNHPLTRRNHPQAFLQFHFATKMSVVIRLAQFN